MLLVATVLLALIGAMLVVWALRPASLRAGRQWARLSPLERSLLLVEAAAGSESESERRRTLDRLALRLGEAQSPQLEQQTRALAWGEGATCTRRPDVARSRGTNDAEWGGAELMVELGRPSRGAIAPPPEAVDPERRRAGVRFRGAANANRSGRARGALSRRRRQRSCRCRTGTRAAPAALAGGKGLMIVIDVSSSTLGFSNTIARSLVALSNDPSQRQVSCSRRRARTSRCPPRPPGRRCADGRG